MKARISTHTVQEDGKGKPFPFREGDIVLVSNNNVSTIRVEEVHLCKEGLVRTATVRVQKGVLNRPVQCLHRLEIEAAAPQVIRKLMVGRSSKRTLLMLKVYLFVRKLSLPKQGKLGRLLQPIVVY